MRLYTCDCCGSEEEKVHSVNISYGENPFRTVYLCGFCNKQAGSVDKALDGPEYPTIPGVPDARDGDAD